MSETKQVPSVLEAFLQNMTILLEARGRILAMSDEELERQAKQKIVKGDDLDIGDYWSLLSS